MTVQEVVRGTWGALEAGRLRAYVALGLGVLCISFTAIFTKWAAMPGPVSSTYRTTTAALFLAIPFAWQMQRRRPNLVGVRFAMLGGTLFALNLALLSSGLLLTSAANATLLDNTAPLWVGLGALLFLHERLRLRYWAGLAMALGGAAVVTRINPASLGALNHGDVLAFSGAFFYALYLLTTQKARQHVDSLSYLWVAVATSAAVLAVISLALNLPLGGYAARSYAVAIGSGIVSQAGGWWLINYALGYLPASSAVVVLLAQPVVTGVLSIYLLGEILTLPQVAGGALVLAGIYLCLRSNAQ
jgi:drug/metabolite transporter (DMT)-like permease